MERDVGYTGTEASSLWDGWLRLSGRKTSTEPLYYNSDQFADEPLRIVERTVRLLGSEIEWQLAVVRSPGRFD